MRLTRSSDLQRSRERQRSQQANRRGVSREPFPIMTSRHNTGTWTLRKITVMMLTRRRARAEQVSGTSRARVAPRALRSKELRIALRQTRACTSMRRRWFPHKAACWMFVGVKRYAHAGLAWGKFSSLRRTQRDSTSKTFVKCLADVTRGRHSNIRFIDRCPIPPFSKLDQNRTHVRSFDERLKSRETRRESKHNFGRKRTQRCHGESLAAVSVKYDLQRRQLGISPAGRPL